jgi:hypothetical protein
VGKKRRASVLSADIENTIITIARGALYLTAMLYERWFSGIDAVILMRLEDDLIILPVHHAAAGGYILKRRNANGDRVVVAADFFRIHGIVDEKEICLAVEWDEELCGMKVPYAFMV